MFNSEIREDLIAGTRPDIIRGKILLTGSSNFDGYEITEYLGMVWGITVRSKDLGQDCLMSCKILTGGELQSYSQLAYESRQQSIDRMMSMATRIGANGIINLKFEHSGANTGSPEVVVYGTAVKLEAIKNFVPTGAVGNILLEINNNVKNKKI